MRFSLSITARPTIQIIQGEPALLQTPLQDEFIIAKFNPKSINFFLVNREMTIARNFIGIDSKLGDLLEDSWNS